MTNSVFLPIPDSHQRSMSAEQDLRKGCHAYIAGTHTSYGYIPSTAAGIVFCILFGLSTIMHLVQLGRSRIWWCSVFVIGGLGMCFPVYLLL